MTTRAMAHALMSLPLLLAACSGKDGGSGKKDAAGDVKKDDAKQADAKQADAEQADAKQAEPPKSGRFRKGAPVPVGLSEEELKEYAEAQGDPMKGSFSLEQALEGDEALADSSKGKLTAVFKTTMGEFECELYEDKAPKTVANFVGLARGVRPWFDQDKDEWVSKPFYDGIIFHRVIENFMIQTGDPTGSGRGGPGFHIADEFDKSLEHRGKGMMSMANRGPNTGSSQFFITVNDTPHLDGKHAIFGKCDPKVPVEISQVKVDPRQGNRPYEPVEIEGIEILRK